MAMPPVALVTGAARGIGRATALALGQAGPGREAHAVVVADEDEAGGLETVRLLEREGATARFATCDVSDEEAVAAAVHTATEAFGRLDVLVHAAAAEGAGAAVHAMAPADWHRMFGVHVHGAFYGIRHALPHMLGAERGVIVTVVGEASRKVGRAGALAAREAVLGLTRAVAEEVAGSGVRVHAVRHALAGGAASGPGDRPLDLGRAAEVAEAVALLCSDAASAVSGQTIEVPGPAF